MGFEIILELVVIRLWTCTHLDMPVLTCILPVLTCTLPVLT